MHNPQPSPLALLQAQLSQSQLPADVSDAARWMDCIVQACLSQVNDYGRFHLPVFGMAQSVELPQRTIRIGGTRWAQQQTSVWQFDMCPLASWIELPLFEPFQVLDDWLVLLPATKCSESEARALSPPMPPRLRHTLGGLDFVVADYGGNESGRLSQAEFLNLIGEHSSLQIHCDKSEGRVEVQAHRGKVLQSQWEARLDEAFTTYPGVLKNSTSSDISVFNAFQLLAAHDLFAQPASLCRRLVRELHNIDMDRINPYLVWRDEPDRLFEFDEREDPMSNDITFGLSAQLGVSVDYVRNIIYPWCTKLAQLAHFDLPELGTFYRVPIPGIELHSPHDSYTVEAGLSFVGTKAPLQEFIGRLDSA